MPKTVVTVVLTAIATTLVNRKFAKRTAAQVTSSWEAREIVQCALSFNRGYGEGYRQGSRIQMIARIKDTLPSLN